MDITIAKHELLIKLLSRKQRRRDTRYGVDLAIVLKEILIWANELVPSESGSILLDDPVVKMRSGKDVNIYFVACYGKGSGPLVGTFIKDKHGIAGETYRTGKPYISEDVKKDSKFFSRIDKMTGFKTKSIIAAPIIIDDSVIGVIELINRRHRKNYDANDLSLLKIFAGYTASLVHNSLIARNFEELSKIDNLTGLHNDRHFYMSLEAEMKKVNGGKGDLSLIFFDLDRFKEVNDTHGHLAGSTVLKEVAEIAREVFRGTSSVIARYGGDEYVIVMPGADIETAGGYAETMRERIASNTFLKKKYGRLMPRNIKKLITCSVGVASFARNIATPNNVRDAVESIIRAADAAMYRSKAEGKNRVSFAPARSGKHTNRGKKL